MGVHSVQNFAADFFARKGVFYHNDMDFKDFFESCRCQLKANEFDCLIMLLEGSGFNVIVLCIIGTRYMSLPFYIGI
ncbi:hypothetical protein ACOSQ3_014082 [Xanthoceras sorbifolium]